MRGRLIKLLKESKCDNDCDGFTNAEICKGCKAYEKHAKSADYLLLNGVIVPPCKVGDVVWLIGNMKMYTKEVCCSRKVTSVQMLRTGELIMHFKDGCFSSEAVGVYVFFSKEEAEAKLKGGADK